MDFELFSVLCFLRKLTNKQYKTDIQAHNFHIKKNGKTDKMKLFAFLGLSVLVGASAIPSENRPQANSFLKREKRQYRS